MPHNLISFRATEGIVAVIDDIARKEGKTRSDIAKRLLKERLDELGGLKGVDVKAFAINSLNKIDRKLKEGVEIKRRSSCKMIFMPKTASL